MKKTRAIAKVKGIRRIGRSGEGREMIWIRECGGEGGVDDGKDEFE